MHLLLVNKAKTTAGTLEAGNFTVALRPKVELVDVFFIATAGRRSY
jgi:hypothetical protein